MVSVDLEGDHLLICQSKQVVPFLLPCQQPWRECGNQLQAIWKVWDWLFSQYKLEGWVGSKLRAQALVPGTLSMNLDLITVSATGTETIMKDVYHHVGQHWCGRSTHSSENPVPNFLFRKQNVPSILKVSSLSNVAERAPAITSAFQASGIKTRKSGGKDLLLCFKGAFKSGSYNTSASVSLARI